MTKPLIKDVTPKWHNEVYANKLRLCFLKETTVSVYSSFHEFGSEPICKNFKPSTVHVCTVLEVYGSEELGFYYLFFMGDETGHFSYVVLSLAELNELSRKNVLQYMNEENPMSSETTTPEAEKIEASVLHHDADTIATSEIGHGEPESEDVESVEAEDADTEDMAAVIDAAVEQISTLRLWHIGKNAVIDLSQVVTLWMCDGNFYVIFKGTNVPVTFAHDEEFVKTFEDLVSSWELAKESEIKLELLSRNPGWVIR